MEFRDEKPMILCFHFHFWIFRTFNSNRVRGHGQSLSIGRSISSYFQLISGNHLLVLLEENGFQNLTEHLFVSCLQVRTAVRGAGCWKYMEKAGLSPCFQLLPYPQRLVYVEVIDGNFWKKFLAYHDFIEGKPYVGIFYQYLIVCVVPMAFSYIC